jgi:uncharacterized protein (TIGR02246 family)
MPLSAQTKTQIQHLLAAYEAAYNTHDIPGLLSVLAPDIRMYGCRKEEEISGRDAFAAMMEKNFARYKTGSLRFDRIEIKGEGVIAWADAVCRLGSVSGAGLLSGTDSRFSAVFRGTGHAWEIVQMHMSLGCPCHE